MAARGPDHSILASVRTEVFNIGDTLAAIALVIYGISGLS